MNEDFTFFPFLFKRFILCIAPNLGESSATGVSTVWLSVHLKEELKAELREV